MCIADLPLKNDTCSKDFDLKSELQKHLIKDKADRIFLDITMNAKYDFCKPISFAQCGSSLRFNSKGELVDYNSDEYSSVYLITFEKKYINKNIDVKEIIYYNFN